MSTKDFKQGMVAGAKPFGDKLDQLADASERGVSDIKEGIEGVENVVGAILDDLSAQEKKHIYDLDEATDISSLEDEEQEFLVAVLTELANTIPEVTDLQKKYLISICSVTNIPAPQTSLNLACIENIESMRTQKILLRHVMEFLFVGEQGYGFLDTYEDTLFCFFSVNRRGVAEIRDCIDRVFNAMGVEGIATRYTFMAGYVEMTEPDEPSEYVEEVDVETTEEEPQEVEMMNVTNMVQVVPGQTLTYRHKELHLSSLINCCGTLELENCIIIFNETDAADEITLESGASFLAKNCTFLCKGFDKAAFISLAEECAATFEQCVFVDCAFFISAGHAKEVTLTNCELYNCGEGFLTYDDGGTLTLDNLKIDIQEDRFDNRKKGTLFKQAEYNSTCTINNVYATCSHYEDERPVMFFNTPAAAITNSTFIGCGECITASKVENCVFENCSGKYVDIISNYVLSSAITGCVFDHCTEIIDIGTSSVITQCKFVDCYDKLINSGGTESEISFCEFINCRNTAKDKKQGQDTSDPTACIKLYAENTSKNSVIKKCIFDGIDIDEGFLISASIHRKLSGRMIQVDGCDFRNCSTRRASGKIIKTFAHYRGMFDSVKNEQAISIVNCRGLDRVQKNGNGVCTDNTVLSSVVATKSSTGVRAAAIGVAGLLGGPIALAVASGASIVATHSQEKDHAASEAASKE